MKEQILNLFELKPNIGYYELSMTFGLSLGDLFKLLDISKYKIGDTYLHIYDTNGNIIYYEDSDGYWTKWVYDTNGYEIYEEHSDGYWYKYEYDNNGNLIYKEYSSSIWIKWEYDKYGNKIYKEDSTGYKRYY